MKKKVLSVVLAASMAAALAGCGGAPEETKAPEPQLLRLRLRLLQKALRARLQRMRLPLLAILKDRS